MDKFFSVPSDIKERFTYPEEAKDKVIVIDSLKGYLYKVAKSGMNDIKKMIIKDILL